MARLFLILAVALVALAVFSVVDCLTADRRSVRGLPKIGWVLLILVLPAIGPLLWFVIGRGPAPRAVGPDDDPAFLARAGSTRTTPLPRPVVRRTDAEEIRRLEEELARSDTDDGDDPGRK